jgi:ABC-type transporter MlaC component
MVEARYAEIQRIISTETSDKAVQKKVVAVLESFTDFREFGRLTMKRYWKDLSEKKKGVFVDKYRQLIHRSYSKRFKANQQLTLSFRGDVQTIGRAKPR